MYYPVAEAFWVVVEIRNDSLDYVTTTCVGRRYVSTTHRILGLLMLSEACGRKHAHLSSDFGWLDQVSLDSSYEANTKRRKATISTPNKILLMWQLVPQEVAKVVRQIRGPHNKGMVAHCQTSGLPKITGSFPFEGGYLGVYRDNGKENGSYYLRFRVSQN